jgi:hypothetical protein
MKQVPSRTDERLEASPAPEPMNVMKQVPSRTDERHEASPVQNL